MNYYNKISENFRVNFLNFLYRYAVLSNKGKLLSDISFRSPFECTSDKDVNMIVVNFGEKKVTYSVIWEVQKTSDVFVRYKILDFKTVKEEDNE